MRYPDNEFAELTPGDLADITKTTAEIVALMKTGPRRMRLEIIAALSRAFCTGCGAVQPEDPVLRCQCENDE